MVAILHNIRSMHNVGSIFRTADGAGVEKLYLCGVTPTPYDVFGKLRPQVAKVALGAEKMVAWEHARSTATVINRLKKNGYKIVAVELHKRAIPYYTLNPKPATLAKLALVFGHEVRGLSASVLQMCDRIIEIPMYGKKESLNVSVAFGVVTFGLRHKT